MSFKGALASRSASIAQQTIADSTDTAVIFDTVDYDHFSGAFNLASQSTRLVIPAAVTNKVRIFGGVWFPTADAATWGRKLWLRKNGTTLVPGLPALSHNANAQGFSFASAPIGSLVAGDYLELMVRQNNGAVSNPEIFKGGAVYLGLEELPADLKCCLLALKGSFQNFPASGATTVPAWNATPIYEVGGDWFDAATNETRMVVPAGVTHLRMSCCMKLSLDMATVTAVQMTFRRNGSTLAIAAPGETVTPIDDASAQAQYIWAATPYFAVSAGDTLQVELFSSHTGSHTILTAEETYFSAEELLDIETSIGAVAASSGAAESSLPPYAPTFVPLVTCAHAPSSARARRTH